MPITINGSSGISGVDGSAGTPALQGSDTDTGISFPAADTVAINTGGAERVRCDSSGNLLIGGSLTLGANGTISNSNAEINGLQMFGLVRLLGTNATTISLTFSSYSVAFVDIAQLITVAGASAEYRLVAGIREGTASTIWINQGTATASWSGNTLTITIPHITGSANTMKFASIRGRGLSNPSINS